MAQSQGNVSVELEGRGSLTLRQGNYVATGGEGTVYRAGSTIIKLYLDPAKMRRDGMPEKIRMLSKLSHPYIVAPQGLAMNDRGEPAGFYMPYAAAEPLSRIFTTAFWNRESFTKQKALTLVDRMRDTVRAAHDFKAVMVDANELNWLASLSGKGGPEPRAIDVDSWAIGKWKASVIMPSIRDWHSREFNQNTDWFAWGVVSFQVLTGVHPYRGTLDGFKAGDIEGRMKANASVFAKGVGLNRAVRDFRNIPAPLLDWYVATFQKGERSIPPSPFDKGLAAIAQPAITWRAVTGASGGLVYDKLFERANDPVVRVFPCGLALLASGALVEVATKRELMSGLSRSAEAVRVKDGWLVADLATGTPVYTYVDRHSYSLAKIDFGLRGLRFFRYENRLFLVTEEELIELFFSHTGKPILAVGKRTQVLSPNATQWFDGVGLQKAFGATFLVLPFGDTACTNVRVRELDDLTAIAAAAGNRFATVVGIDKAGSYFRVDLTFNASYASYAATRTEVDSPDLNVALLPKGVGAMIENDGELKIFVPTNGTVRLISDKQIATDMALAHMNDGVVYVKTGALWSVKTT